MALRLCWFGWCLFLSSAYSQFAVPRPNLTFCTTVSTEHVPTEDFIRSFKPDLDSCNGKMFRTDIGYCEKNEIKPCYTICGDFSRIQKCQRKCRYYYICNHGTYDQNRTYCRKNFMDHDRPEVTTTATPTTVCPPVGVPYSEIAEYCDKTESPYLTWASIAMNGLLLVIIIMLVALLLCRSRCAKTGGERTPADRNRLPLDSVEMMRRQRTYLGVERNGNLSAASSMVRSNSRRVVITPAMSVADVEYADSLLTEENPNTPMLTPNMPARIRGPTDLPGIRAADSMPLSSSHQTVTTDEQGQLVVTQRLVVPRPGVDNRSTSRLTVPQQGSRLADSRRSF